MGDIEDLCELCGEMGEETRALGVTRYPMAKERKQAREEETAVCVLEWESSKGGERKVLLLKRPEKGSFVSSALEKKLTTPPQDFSLACSSSPPSTSPPTRTRPLPRASKPFTSFSTSSSSLQSLPSPPLPAFSSPPPTSCRSPRSTRIKYASTTSSASSSPRLLCQNSRRVRRRRRQARASSGGGSGSTKRVSRERISEVRSARCGKCGWVEGLDRGRRRGGLRRRRWSGRRARVRRRRVRRARRRRSSSSERSELS